MTVSTEVSRIIVQGNGVTVTFSYTFPIVGTSDTDQTNCQLIYTDTTGVSTTQADNLWSITGVVTQPTDWVSGTFRLSTSTPITTGATLTLERTQPYTQTTTLGNQSAYSPEVVEAALDDLALQTEQLNTWRLQSLRAPITDVALNDMPNATSRAGGYLTFDSSGQPTISLGAQSAVITGVAIPGGRLTLTAATPVMTSDVTTATTVHYCTYATNTVPVWNGTTLVGLAIPSDDTTLILNGTDNANAHIYDVFGFNNSSVLAIGTGPAWTSNTARGTGAGTTELQLKSGLWTNKNSIALRSNGSLLATVSANQATYLGSLYTTNAGQTGMAFTPAAASGGSNNFLGLWNAYNRVTFRALCRDSTATWSFNTNTTWRAANAAGTGSGLLNRISWVDGLAQSNGNGEYNQTAQAGTSAQAWLGCVQNWSSGGPAYNGISGVAGSFVPITAPCVILAGLGLQFLQAIEATSTTANATYAANGAAQALVVTIPM